MSKQPVRAASNKRRWISNLALAGGLALVGVWLWSNFHTALYQHWQNGIFERRKQAAKPAPARPRALRKGEVLGRLVVPRLHLSAMVREGDGSDILEVALGHIPGTALPGQKGNVGVAGHRDTLFRALRGIRDDDVIEFQTVDADYQYRVLSTQIVKPQEVSVLRAGDAPEITLVTCYPFYYVGSAPKRFIVKARQVGAEVQLAPREKAWTEAATVPPPPAPAPPPPPRPPAPRPVGPRRVAFRVAENHSRELAPGISIGLSWTDPGRRVVNGWMWLMPERRTIWLRDQSADQPIVFYGYADGRERKLVITQVTPNSVSGYLVLPEIAGSN
jgi:sortase A